MSVSQPRFPVYIPSRGRASIATTPRHFDQTGVPYRLIVEADEADVYAKTYGDQRVLVLPESYISEYQWGRDFSGGTAGHAAGPARNFARDHSVSEGHPWHWVIDDNIFYFGRLHQNRRVPSGDGMIFAAMEDFCTRYLNVGVAGPDYWWFVKARTPQAAPYVINRRIMSCYLIRNDTGIRWHGRYNEDVILTLDHLKSGWCTVCFRTFLQFKARTQTMPGGCNTELYKGTPGGGTLWKSQFLVDLFPDDVRLQQRFGRVHHWVDYRPYRNLSLIRDPAWTPPAANPYATREFDAGVTARPSIKAARR